MSIVKRFVHAWLPVLAAFFIGAAFVGVAFAATTTFRGTVKAKNFQYLRPKTVQYVVPGSAFVAGNTTNPDHGNFSGEVDVPASDSVVAAVNLPQGAVVTKVAVWTGTTAGGDFDLHLEANNLTGGHADMTVLSPIACPAKPCVASTTNIRPNTINNAKKAYGIWIGDNGGGSTVYRVVVTYKTSGVGPVSGVPAGASWSGPAATND